MPAYNTNLLNPFATNPTNLGASLSALSGTSSNFHAVLNSLGTISGKQVVGLAFNKNTTLNNSLTSLDLSASGGYDYIYVQGNSISSITIAEGTSYVNDRPDYNLSTNSLSNTSIDEFFTSLGDGLYFDDSLGLINVSGNTGSATCNTFIAIDKNWSPTV